MRRSSHRANQFAGRVLTLHARHRLEKTLWIVPRTVVVGVDANPVHVAALERLLLPNHGNVVLRLAGNNAVVAAHAGVQVDRHAPGIGFLGVVHVRIEREFLRHLAFLGEVRFFLVLLEIALLHQRTLSDRSFHRLVTLRAGEVVSCAGRSQLNAAREPGILAGAQRIDIVASAGARAPGTRASVAEENRDRVVGVSRLNPDRAFNFLALELEFDNVFEGELQSLGHRGANHDRIVPGQLGQWLRKLLQPCVVREAAVVDGRIAAEVEFNA